MLLANRYVTYSKKCCFISSATNKVLLKCYCQSTKHGKIHIAQVFVGQTVKPKNKNISKMSCDTKKVRTTDKAIFD